MWLWILGIILVTAIIIGIIIYWLHLNDQSIHEVTCEEMYKEVFKENIFKPTVNKENYYKQVKSGYNIAKNKTLTIAGLGYNLGKDKCSMLMRRLEHLSESFKKVYVIIYSCDSTDETYEYLKTARSKYSTIFHLILPDEKIDKKGLSRMMKMTKLRNILLKEYRKRESDYLLMVDYDLQGPISRDGLMHNVHCMEKDGYAMLSANGLVNITGLHVSFYYFGWVYYDPFAFTYIDGQDMIKNKIRVYKKRGDDIIPVRSAFSGAALYDSKKLKGINYIEQDKICEHKTLNYQLVLKNYKLGMNPSFILLSGIQGNGRHR